MFWHSILSDIYSHRQSWHSTWHSISYIPDYSGSFPFWDLVILTLSYLAIWHSVRELARHPYNRSIGNDGFNGNAINQATFPLKAWNSAFSIVLGIINNVLFGWALKSQNRMEQEPKLLSGLKLYLFFSPLSTTWTWQTWDDFRWHMRVSINGGTPKSSTLIWFSLINHPFWGTPIHGNPHMVTFIFFRLHESTSRQGHRGWAGGDLQRVPPQGTGVPAAAGAGRADQDGRAGESPEWKRYGYILGGWWC